MSSARSALRPSSRPVPPTDVSPRLCRSAVRRPGLGPPVASYAPARSLRRGALDDDGTAVLVKPLPGTLGDVLFGSRDGASRCREVVGRPAWITGEPRLLHECPRGSRESVHRPTRWRGRRRRHRARRGRRPGGAVAIGRGGCRTGDVCAVRLASPVCPTPRCVSPCSRWRRWPTIASASRRRSTRPSAAPTPT